MTSTDERAPRRFFLVSRELGCPVNLAFTTQLHNYVERNRWSFAEIDDADYLVFVNCSTLPQYREGVPRTVEYLAHRFPSKQIVVTCCYVPQDMVVEHNVTYIPLSHKERFDELLGATVPLGEVPSGSTPADDARARALSDTRAKLSLPYNVLVSTGCLNHCAFCIQKNIFPTVQSVPPEKVVAECRRAIDSGYTNLAIGAADIASWGRDLGLDVTDLFAALFSEVLRRNHQIVIGFHAFEPAGFLRHFDRLADYFKEGRIDWIRMPIQSGSDSVLRSMGRNYKAQDVVRVVRELRCIAPGLRIDTDFLFCFPTETAEDFEASLKLLGEFDHYSLIMFGRHENTRAWAMPDVFDAAEKERRARVLASIPIPQGVERPECRPRGEVPVPSPRGPSLFSILQAHPGHKP